MEQKIAQAAGFRFDTVTSGKIRRYHNRHLLANIFDLETLFLNIRDLFRVARGIFQAFGILRRFKPNIIFLKGGYVGLPLGIAAGVMRIPYVIHESDTLPGLANRILAKRATKIATGFPIDKYGPVFPASKLEYVGNPVRSELLTVHRLEGLAHFGLQADLPIIFVTGGSQGAHAINQAVVGALPELTQYFQVIHHTGEKEIEQVRFEVSRLKLKYPKRYQAFSFLTNDMGLALAAADIVVARAGANTIAELASLAKPTILVPNHRLTGGHQTENARMLGRAGAVRVLGEDKLSPRSLTAELRKISGDSAEMERLAEHIANFARPNAARDLAQLLVDNARADKQPKAVDEEGSGERSGDHHE